MRSCMPASCRPSPRSLPSCACSRLRCRLSCRRGAGSATSVRAARFRSRPRSRPPTQGPSSAVSLAALLRGLASAFGLVLSALLLSARPCCAACPFSELLWCSPPLAGWAWCTDLCALLFHRVLSACASAVPCNPGSFAKDDGQAGLVVRIDCVAVIAVHSDLAVHSGCSSCQIYLVGSRFSAGSPKSAHSTTNGRLHWFAFD